MSIFEGGTGPEGVLLLIFSQMHILSSIVAKHADIYATISAPTPTPSQRFVKHVHRSIQNCFL